MHLTLTVALTATSALRNVPIDSTNPFSSIPIPSLGLRQEALARPPPETSVVLVTSMVTVTSAFIATSIVNPKPQTSKPPATTASIATTTTRSTPSSTSDEPRSTNSTTMSDLPPTSSTSQELPPTSSAASTTPSATETRSSLPKPANQSQPPENNGKHIGLIAGLAVGSVIGAILLGLFIYWLCALRRGVNVCNCFGSGGRKKHEDKALPHPLVLYPGYNKPLPRRPEVPYPMSGIGAAQRMESVPRASMLPSQGAEEWTSRLQRKPDLGARKGLDTIPEF